MKEITSSQELKSILTDILIDVDDFCKKNNILYYLAFGTLLGAVRHNGFIPWDDDLDIMMPRDDYERFINSYCSPKYKCVHLGNDSKYFYPFAKVYDVDTVIIEDIMFSSEFGVYLDIFPIDGVPDKKTHNYLRKPILLQKVLRHKYSPISRPRNKVKKVLIHITKLLLKPFSPHYIAKKINDSACLFSYNDCQNVGVLVWGYDYKTFKRSMLGKGTGMLFENNTFIVPNDYDEILKSIYGDYMVLPPVEKRVSVHCFKAFYK